MRTRLADALFWLLARLAVPSDLCGYTAIVTWSADDGAYRATAPAWPGGSGFGATPYQALYELGVVIPVFVELAQEDGIPLPSNPKIATIGQPVIRPVMGLERGAADEED